MYPMQAGPTYFLSLHICECSAMFYLCGGFNPLWCLATAKFSLTLHWFSQKYIADPLWFYHKWSTGVQTCYLIRVPGHYWAIICSCLVVDVLKTRLEDLMTMPAEMSSRCLIIYPCISA